MTKKYITMIMLLLSVCLLLTGCNPGCFCDYRPSYWVSEDPDIRLTVYDGNIVTVSDEYQVFGHIEARPISAELYMDGKKIDLEIDCGTGFVHFYYSEYHEEPYDDFDPTEAICSGSWKLNEKTMVATITINKDRDSLFNGKYDKITFVQSEAPSDATSTDGTSE